MADNHPIQDPIGSELVKDDASFADLVIEFLDGMPARLEKLERAISDGDFETLRMTAHQLKGSGGGYGYPQVTDQAAQLERKAKAQTLDDCVKSLDELKSLCNRLVVSTDN